MPIKSSKSMFYLLIAGVVFSALIGCRSKFEVKSSSGELPEPEKEKEEVVSTVETNLPEPKPIKIPTEVAAVTLPEGTKTYFQSRDVKFLRFKWEAVADAQSFTLLNTTLSGADDSKAAVLIDQDAPQAGFRSAAGYTIENLGAKDFLIKFFPFAGNNPKHFIHNVTGPNNFKIIAEDSQYPRFARTSIHVYDFEVMGFTQMAFSKNVATHVDDESEVIFHGTSASMWPPVTSSVDGKLVLSNGTMNIINTQ